MAEIKFSQFITHPTLVDDTVYLVGYDTMSGLNIKTLATDLPFISSRSGTTNYIPKFVGPNDVGNSSIYQSGNKILIGSTTDAGAFNFQLTGDGLVTEDFFVEGTFNAGQNLLIVDKANEWITTQYGGNDLGLFLDFPNAIYTLGDYNDYNNGTKIIVADNSQAVDIRSSNVKLTGISNTTTSDILYYNTTTNALTYGPKPSGTVSSVSALTLGTAGTDVNSSVSNPTTTPSITLNVPTASSSTRGALSSSDWTTFNNKVGGSGTANAIPRFNGVSSISNSLIIDDGTVVKTSYGINDVGISLDFGSGIYKFGNFSGDDQSFVQVDANTLRISFNGVLDYTNNVDDATRGTEAGIIKVLIGGTYYCIPYYNRITP